MRAPLGLLSVPPGPASLSSVPPAGFQTTLAAPSAAPRRPWIALSVTGAAAVIAVVGLVRIGIDRAEPVARPTPPATRGEHPTKALATEPPDAITSSAAVEPAAPVHHGPPRPSHAAPATASNPPASPPAASPAPSTLVRDPGF
jgi:hypothetical protein